MRTDFEPQKLTGQFEIFLAKIDWASNRYIWTLNQDRRQQTSVQNYLEFQKQIETSFEQISHKTSTRQIEK